ncbi:hypothetical protein ACFPZ0_18150 [Streptomonospora nanhaiensis]|uniref:hypothetical protein n=1 Tax=Streptomonospora nanhaiensis TaxID=1323731 RepID=UPI001C38BD95|nr:hypothetical protein [Streptomonospora nanhaiensis]MBV2364455.1 hypothetical protein [Streptomonospora nanhaiensis]MBX9387897.1 hypothetical protein [Streptomonospora nanhaiensis]
MSAERSTPPLADYDGLPVATLRHRVRSLTTEQMRDLIAYESSHGNRFQVLEILKSRLAELEAGARPSGGDQEFQPETPDAPRGGSAVSPGGQGPAGNPPPHGVPAQPARPKGDFRPGGS